jgi:hypothetical protein
MVEGLRACLATNTSESFWSYEIEDYRTGAYERGELSDSSPPPDRHRTQPEVYWDL